MLPRVSLSRRRLRITNSLSILASSFVPPFAARARA